MTPRPLLARLLSKISPEPNTGCWLWTGALTSAGYGSVGSGGHAKSTLAHRAMYEALRGPIPPGLVLDHRACSQRSCCNPAHLEPVSNRTNILRGVGASAVNARKVACVEGHPLTGDNLRIESAGARRCRTCERTRKSLARTLTRPATKTARAA